MKASMSSSYTMGPPLFAPKPQSQAHLASLGDSIPNRSQNILESAFRSTIMAKTKSPVSCCRFPTIEKRLSSFRSQRRGKARSTMRLPFQGPSSSCRLHPGYRSRGQRTSLITPKGVLQTNSMSLFPLQQINEATIYLCEHKGRRVKPHLWGSWPAKERPHRLPQTCPTSKQEGIPELGQLGQMSHHSGCLCMETGLQGCCFLGESSLTAEAEETVKASSSNSLLPQDSWCPDHCWAPSVHIGPKILTPRSALWFTGAPAQAAQLGAQALLQPLLDSEARPRPGLTTEIGRPVGLPSPQKPVARATEESTPPGTTTGQAWGWGRRKAEQKQGMYAAWACLYPESWGQQGSLHSTHCQKHHGAPASLLPAEMPLNLPSSEKARVKLSPRRVTGLQVLGYARLEQTGLCQICTEMCIGTSTGKHLSGMVGTSPQTHT